jgi:ATP-dependent helicase/nuclease subunit A
MLAERMAAGVASGVYDIAHMAAVTFTRKAASELRGRFHLALENRLTELEEAPDREERTGEADRLHAALGNLERFFAGTIHSFCARLLRERPVESGVSPGFTELDEVQAEDLRTRAWRDFIASASAAGDPDMLALLDAGVRPQDLDAAFATICLNEDVEFPPGDGACPDPGPAWAATQKFWAKLVRELPATIDPETTCAIQKAAREHQRRLRVARRRVGRPAVVADLLDEWDCESKIVQKWWADTAAEKTRLRDLIQPLHERFRTETVGPFMRAWRHYVYRLAVTLLVRARAHAARERRRLDVLDYGDLLILTAGVLRGNTHVRRTLQRKYRYLFVDEFQDTDPIQAEIVFLLAAGDASGDDWRQMPLRPGALFVVGDPKQSIYRFRRADIEIYNTVRERFGDPAVGRVVTLTTNFRSVPALCAWATTVFDGPFPADPTRYSPRFAPLDPDPSRGDDASGGVFTLTYGGDAKAVPAEDAARIARYIRAEVDAGRRRYSDFLILTRKKKDRLAPYAEALEALNVPLEVSGAGAFGDSAEVQALTTLLRVLADPEDQLPLVAVLRGPLFGLSDPELFEFRQAGGWLSIFFEPSATPAPEALRAGYEAVAAALATLRQHHRWTRVLPAGAALDRILEDTGDLALAATTPGGAEAGDLLHALDRIRQVVEAGGTLADAADALEADSEFTSEVESLPLEPGRTDLVRLMNLHKAKGLEADVVFLADPAGGVKPRVDVRVERTGATALGWFRIEKRSDHSFKTTALARPADWERHEAAELRYLLAEETRLLYVAATRARQMLVVSRHAPQRGPGAWGLLNDALRAAREVRVPSNVRIRVPEPSVCDANARDEADRARLSAVSRIQAPSWSIASVTADAKRLASVTARPEQVAKDDATRVVAQDTASHRADVGMAWGALVHGLLEHAMRHEHASREDLRRLALWLTVEEPRLRTVIDQALDTVEGVMRAEFWTAARSSEHAEEVPFAVSEASGQISTGVVDLLYRADDAWSVVDYKTDAAPDAAAQAAYAQQLAKYRQALEACGLRVGSAEVRPVRGANTGSASEVE